MRGKNILLMSVIAMLLSVMMVNVGTAPVPSATKLYADPNRLPEQAGTLGHVGDEYYVSIKIDAVEDLYAVGFTIKFAPYVRTLVASNVVEGDFLSQGGYNTAMSYKISAFAGTLKVGITRLGTVTGASGSGTLMTFKLTCIEAGDSPIDIVDDYLVDSNLSPIDHNTWSSSYHGCTANLIRSNMPDGRRPQVGETFTFNTKVVNKGDVPLCVRGRYDIERLEDGRRITLYAGQTYVGGGLGEPRPFTYLYLDEFNEWYYEWKNPATNALGTPDGEYIEGDANAQWASLYSFEDIDLAGRTIADITIEGYSQYPNGASEGLDIDLYGFSSVQGFAWLGSNYGTAAWGWHGVRWTSDSVFTIMPELGDETELNNMELLIYNYYGDAPDVMRVDSMRLKVEFSGIVPVEAPVFCLGPYPTELDLDPVTWVADSEHVGTYIVSVTVEYSELYDDLGFHWKNMGEKVRTFSFEIQG